MDEMLIVIVLAIAGFGCGFLFTAHAYENYVNVEALGRNICAEQDLAYDSYDAKYSGDNPDEYTLNLTINCKKPIIKPAKEVLHQDGIIVVDVSGGK